MRLTFDGDMATVWLDRPPVNAVDKHMIAALHEAFRRAAAGETAAIVVRSALPVFCGGADLRERVPDEYRDQRAVDWREMLATVLASPVPTVALVNGPCIGSGMGLISRCDLRIATSDATFALPEIKVGRAGGAAHMRRFMSEGRVREMLLTGRALDAETAYTWGLVNEIVENFDDDQPSLVRQVVQHGRAKLALMKVALDRSEEGGYPAEQEITARLRDEGHALDLPERL